MKKDSNNNYNFDDINISFLENMLKQLPSNIYFKDNQGKYVFCTHYWNHLKTEDDLNWSIKGKTDIEIRKDKENAKKAHESDMEILKTGKGKNYTIRIDVDNNVEYFEVIKEPVFDNNGMIMGIVGLINDITKRIELEHQLEELARRDTLTNLYNRTYLDYWINNLNYSQNYPLGIIFADCNYLKHINDKYGHQAGDEYIVKTANLMKIVLPRDSKIIRYGGDEFVAILNNSSLECLDNYIDKMKKLCLNLEVCGNTLSVAFGQSIVLSPEQDFFDKLKEADNNMYDNKMKYHDQ